MNHHIYGLIDPRTNQIRYVGKAVDTTERLATHIREARNGSVLHSRRWIAGVMGAGFRPDLIVLETCATNAEANDAERFWIGYFRFLGADLTNRTPGGDGQPKGYRPSPDAVARGAAKVRGIKRTEEQKARLREAFNTPEMRAVRSRNVRALANDPEWREKIGRGNRGKKLSAETKRRQSASWTPERKAKHRAQQKAKPVDDRWKAQLAASRAARWARWRAAGRPKIKYRKRVPKEQLCLLLTA